MKRQTVRYLKPGESVPTDIEPIRIPWKGRNTTYVRLLWKVAPWTYVGAYEHRIHNGRIVDSGLEVHHINGNGLDNRPENLEIVTPVQHRRIHQLTWDPAEGLMLYDSGFNTREVGLICGVSQRAVCEQFKQMGLPARPTGRPRKELA